MITKLTRLSIIAFALMCGLSLTAFAQDFVKTYPLGPDGSISITNISGNVKVTGTDGGGVVVMGFKEGRDREMVDILDRSSANRVDVKAKYPENCDCDASVRFEVQVPRSVAYRFDSISSISGDVSVTNVSGDLKVRSISGSVEVKGATGNVNASAISGEVKVEDVNGTVSAKSTSGEVRVDINRVEGAANRMDFASVSGGVTVRLPANADADVEMSVLTGNLKTDFPLQIDEPERGPGRKAHGVIGGGGARKLRLSSISGNVNLLRQ
jgi:hypothetical protein